MIEIVFFFHIVVYLKIDSDSSQSVCDSGSLCYENDYGCYLDKYEIPGFKKYKWNQDCPLNDIDSFNVTTISECSLNCFKKSNCVAFHIALNGQCYSKFRCTSYRSLQNAVIYHRFMDIRFTCFLGGLDNLGNQYYKSDSEIETVKTSSIVHRRPIVISEYGTRIKVRNSLNLIFHLIEFYNFQAATLKDINKEYNQVTCFPGSLINSEENESPIVTSFHTVLDFNHGTCYTAKKHPFQLRYPWPTHNNNNIIFNVEITGNNLQCFDSSTWTGNTGLIVYVPIAIQVTPKFTGNFLSCAVKSSISTKCVYRCSCQGEICQAFYIDFKDESEIMKVCEISRAF